jgi:hypothetical protein
MSNENFNKSKDLIGFDFIFDSNGNYVYTASEYGFGKKVNIRGKITIPEDGTYSVSIVSSDGGGGSWQGIKANQEISCIINTSFFHKTTITVTINSNKPNSKGNVIIDYSLS